MGEAKKREVAVRQQVVERWDYRARAGRSKCAGMGTVRPQRKDRWRFSSSFLSPPAYSING
jgi:hypothetical protein